MAVYLSILNYDTMDKEGPGHWPLALRGQILASETSLNRLENVLARLVSTGWKMG